MPDTVYGLQLNSKTTMVMTDDEGHLLAPFPYQFKTRK
jgi:hypothetical protein